MRGRSLLWLAGLAFAVAAATVVWRLEGARARVVPDVAVTDATPLDPVPSAALAAPPVSEETVGMVPDASVARVPLDSALPATRALPAVDAIVRWRAIDAASGAPVAGATVRATSARGPVQSDANGAFELPRTQWFARIEAPGYARRWLEPGPDCGELGRPCLVELERSAILELHIVDGAGAPAGNAEVQVTSEPGCNPNSRLEGHWSVDRDRWSAEVGADGECSLELPPREPLYLSVRERARDGYGWREPVPFLEPGEHRVLTRLRDGLVIEGVVVDAGGEPQAKLTVWLTPASVSFTSDQLRHAATDELRAFRAESDLHGRFAFQNVPVGTWRLELPPQQFGHFAQRVTALPLEVEVGLEPVPPLTLTVWRGLYIRGQVLRPDGAPFRPVTPHPCWITASTAGFETRAHVRAGGVFEVGPLVAGTYRVHASGSVGFAASAPVTAQAGDEGIALVLREGASVTGVVLGGDGLPSPRARVDLIGADVPKATALTDDSGGFRFVEIVPGAYDVVAQGAATGVGRLHDVPVAAGANRTLVVRLEPTAGATPVR